MEFVMVLYPTERDVNVGGGPLGKTGKKLKVQTGTHTFDLDRPLDYTPSSQTVPVSGTTKDTPCLIFFTPRIAMRGGVRPAAKKRAGKSAKKNAKKNAKKSAKKSAKKASKKATRKGGRKLSKKVAGKATKKSARKTARKTAKKAARTRRVR